MKALQVLRLPRNTRPRPTASLVARLPPTSMKVLQVLRLPRKTSLRCSKCCSTPATQNEVLLRLRCCVGAFVLMVLRGLFSMETFPLYSTGTLRGLFSMETFPLYGDFTGIVLYGDFSSLLLFTGTLLYGDFSSLLLFTGTLLYGDFSSLLLFTGTLLYGDFSSLLLFTGALRGLFSMETFPLYSSLRRLYGDSSLYPQSFNVIYIPSYVTVMWVFYGIYPVIPGYIWVLHGQKTPLTVLRGARTSKWRVTWGNLWTDYGCRRW